MTTPGHNGSDAALKSYVERIERLAAEKDALTVDIREVYTEAKGNGFDPKIMRAVVRDRRMDEAKRRERDELIETYKAALGMLSDTPLGKSAMERV